MRKELRKWITVLTLGLLLGTITVSVVAEEYTFRKTTWGMNRQQVKNTETKEIGYEGEKILGYEGSILSLDCWIAYIFVEGKLVRANYVIDEEHSNENTYIKDYYTLKATLSKKYGKPLEFEEVWLNDLYKDDPEDWGLAISIGQLSYYAMWKTLETDIVLSLNGDNYEITLTIQYRSKELGELEEKEKERKALEDL